MRPVADKFDGTRADLPVAKHIERRRNFVEKLRVALAARDLVLVEASPGRASGQQAWALTVAVGEKGRVERLQFLLDETTDGFDPTIIPPMVDVIAHSLNG